MCRLVYISQDGFAPSGITTYGRSMLKQFAKARMLLLNSGSPIASEQSIDRVTAIERNRSHEIGVVSARLAEMVGASVGTALLPNTGDTPWAATMEFLHSCAPALRERVRVLGIVHSDVETQYALAERYLPIAPVWIGVSRRCADELRRRVGSRGARVYELPYPVELPESSGHRSPSGPLRLAYVGRLEEPQKRISRLAQLFDRLIEAKIDFRATVAGDGPASGDFKRMLERLGAAGADRVSFVGAIDPAEVEKVWQTHDVCLLTSMFEGMPLALLEAMAAGACPVVMAVESGLPELVQDGANARVVPQGDVEAMAQVIQELSMDRGQAERLGQAARDTVRERFSPEAHFKKLTEIIDELWAMPPPDPDLVAPDPTALAVARLVEGARTSGGAVAIYGAGMFGRKVVDACLDAGIPVSAWFDSDPARGGLVYRGLTCLGPPEIPRHAGATFLVGSLEFATEIAERIRSAARVAAVTIPRIVTARDGSQVQGSA